jgi:hypothetical protein
MILGLWEASMIDRPRKRATEHPDQIHSWTGHQLQTDRHKPK